ncbi:MAG: MAPEG family protein [Cellvibrionaceae bacterium]
MIYAIAAMVLLTFVVGAVTVKVRFASVKSRKVSAKYFKLMHGTDVPEMVTKTTRCFNNQFEIPVLFYTAGTLYISLGLESLVGLVFAWLFVMLRCIHAYIHLTYNHLLHRMLSFWFAFIAVIVMWLNLLAHQI